MQFTIIIILTTIIILVFIAGIFLFIIQYRKRKIEHAQEKQMINVRHHTALQEATLEMQQLTMQDIGREIHDGVGQRLILASIYTRQLLRNDMPIAVQVKAEEINLILNESLEQLRNLSKELTREKDDEVDLEKLISSECKKMKALQICNINYSHNGESYISYKKAMFIVRILQEFLQNSLKHADCKTISISLHKTQRELTLNLADDGKGYHTEELSKGIGLHNMRRRAEMIDATLNMQSELTKGTSLRLILSLP